MYQTPILLLVFNRPDTTKKVIEAIREVKPKKLFVVADGPRKNKAGEEIICEEVRKIVTDAVDWKCELITDFRSENLGCGYGVYKAISWFFEHVEKGIILEDDCLANPSFFAFCEELLNLYKDNDKVMHISGNNFQFGKKFGNASYYFSNYSHIWGWATWRRAWNKYQFELNDLEQSIQNGLFNHLETNETEIKFWTNIFEELKNGKQDVWDGQWLYTVWKNKGFTILPNVNLVKNIGFNSDATHTHSHENIMSNIETVSIDQIKHPEEIKVFKGADARSFKIIFLNQLTFQMKIKNKLKQIFQLKTS